MVIKLSDEQAAKLGITKETDFGAFLETLTARVTGLEDSTKTFSTAAAVKIIEDGLRANTESIGTLTAKVEAIPSAEDIKKTASEAASLTAATALGTAGMNPIKANPAESQVEADSAEALIKAGKYEEAYAASEKLQADFLNAKSYAAYARAEAAGSIKFQRK